MFMATAATRCILLTRGRLAGCNIHPGVSRAFDTENTNCFAAGIGAAQSVSTSAGPEMTMTSGPQQAPRSSRRHRLPGVTSGHKPELVIFDKHGTLINFNSVWSPWLQAFTSRLEFDTGLGLREQVYRGLGVCAITERARHGVLADGTRADIKRNVEDILHDSGLPRRKAQLVVETCWEECDMNRPGAVQQLEDLGDIFRRLKESNIKIAVCSSAPSGCTLKTLRQLDLASVVDKVMCTDDADNSRGSSWRKIYGICKELKVEPSRTVVIGDSAADMLMGSDAGVGLTVGVLSGVGTRLDLAPYADYTVPTVKEAMRHIFDGSLWRKAAVVPHAGSKTPSWWRSSAGRPGNKASLVIFDKDGTLICFNSMWTPWLKDLVTGLEQKTGLRLYEKIFTDLGYDHGAARWRSGLMAEAPMAQVRAKLTTRLQQEGLSASEAEQTVDGVWQETISCTKKHVKPLDDPSRLFKLLKDVGVKVAVCTSDSRAATMQCLKAMAVEPYIDLLVCGDDPNTEPKPSGHNALLICKTLGVQPTETVVVGDTLADLGMGRSAELGATVAVLTGIGGVEDLTPFADHVVPSIKHVLGLVAPEQQH